MLSIVIPAREEEKAIGTTVSQLKNALSMPCEIIVSDDGSHDRTVEVAERSGARVVRFSGERHTPGRTRNAGGHAAKGEFIAFIDADVSFPHADDFFKRALAHFRKDARLVGVTGPQRARRDVETWADRVSFGILNVLLRFQNNVLHRGEASGKLTIVRKEAFEAVGGFREDIATREDADFFNRLSKIGHTLFDPSLMIYHGARRAHRIGWARLWYIWAANTVWFGLFGKSFDDDWKPIR